MSPETPQLAQRSRGIAVVCHPSLGGSGIAATDLAVGFARRGHRVHVITSGALARPLPSCRNLHLHVVDVPAYPLFEHPPEMLALAGTMAQVCAEHALDVLHVHYAVPHASSAYLARQLLARHAPALVCSLHGTDVTSVGIEPAYHAITRMCVEASDAITTPSTYLRDTAHALLGIARDRVVEVVPNGVDTETFSPAQRVDPHYFDALFGAAHAQHAGERYPTLLHVSNFRPVKRTLDLIDVLANLRKRVPARLVLIGEGPERRACEARGHELGVADHVRFLGARADVHAYLRHASAFVLTSQTESFGLAALEALSSGVPVFGYRVGGLPSVVCEEAGRLVAPFDTRALATAIADVLSDQAQRDQLARAARRRALESFQLEPVLERYEGLFERICAQRLTP